MPISLKMELGLTIHQNMGVGIGKLCGDKFPTLFTNP
jgi:hypothetical protein